MPPLLLDGLFLVLGFALLAKGAGALVDGGVALAKGFSVPPMVIGLTVVALGTSLPEVVVASLATDRGEYGLALGTVLGSNIANIGLVLGVTGLLLPRLFAVALTVRETLWLLGSLGLLYFLCAGGSLEWPEGLILLVAFVLYQALVMLRPGEEAWFPTDDVAVPGLRHPWVMVFVGSLAIGLGAYWAMEGGIGLAETLGVPTAVIGFTVLAVGTSLPELAAGIASVAKGNAELGLGNVVGSNIFNTLMVLGIAFVTSPLEGDAEGILEQTAAKDLPMTGAFTLALVLMLTLAKGRLLRWKAAALVVAYFVWAASRFMSG